MPCAEDLVLPKVISYCIIYCGKEYCFGIVWKRHCRETLDRESNERTFSFGVRSERLVIGSI